MTMSMEKWVAGGIAALVAGLLVLAGSGLGRPVHAAPASVDVPVPTGAADLRQPGVHRAQVVFAGGCFWGVQGVFQHVKGVDGAVSGYIGGSAADARYPRVSSGGTGHAEAVQVTYDPSRVSLAQLLQVFFSVVHDPTQRDRQGPDRGSQYRSAVHADDAAQRAAALAYIDQLQRSGVFAAPVVTRVEGGRRFYPAEDYHQNYLALHPDAAYIRFYDLPKIEALKRQYPALYRDAPRLVMPVSVR
ncbi:peptide-methionine (S)-S-oxide reductase MsrA [Stenotrophomonas acidaminiphila]